VGVKSLHLHIDRIVVEGLPESGQRQFLSALETHLRELAESGIANHFMRNTRQRLPSLDAGELRPGASPAQAAAQVAAAIRQTLNPPTVSNKSRGKEVRRHV
jgi:hypothetical protein